MISFALGCFVACEGNQDDQTLCANGHSFSAYGICTVCGSEDPDYKPTDYVSQLKLDEKSGTAQLNVTVKAYIDGDTTHFYANNSAFPNGVLKARYLAINTPESTGKIEPYGTTASKFTKEKLKNAVAIRVESDTSVWSPDSTGSRYLCWVWYKAQEGGDWRNLNLEILQEGLAIASNTSQNRYGTICMDALNQARGRKLYCHSGKKDPNMYYGSAQEITLRELRCNIASYNGIKVAFEGTVIVNSGSQGVYVQDYDEESETYNGIYVYYGYNANGDVVEALKPGNRVRVVGTCSYYETGGTYQVSGLSYDVMKPDDPENTKLIEKGQASDVVFTQITAVDLLERKITVDVKKIEDDEETIVPTTFDYAQFIYNTAVEMKGLKVTKMYTTDNGGNSDGAITLTCETEDGKKVIVRTGILKDGKTTVTEDYFNGKTIDVKGVVESFDGDIQIKLLRFSDVSFVN